MLIAQNNAPSGSTAGAGTTSDQNNAASSGANTGAATTGNDQTGAAAGTTSSDQTGAAAGTTDNTGAATGTKRHGKNGNLPQTASPLPLLGLLGLGSTGLGILASKKRRS